MSEVSSSEGGIGERIRIDWELGSREIDKIIESGI